MLHLQWFRWLWSHRVWCQLKAVTANPECPGDGGTGADRGVRLDSYPADRPVQPAAGSAGVMEYRQPPARPRLRADAASHLRYPLPPSNRPVLRDAATWCLHTPR